MSTDVKKLRADLRTAFGDYYQTEGCSCCRDDEGHAEAAARIAELLNVPPYSDGSGYDFRKYAPKRY